MIETMIWDRIRLIGERRLFSFCLLLFSIQVAQAQPGCLDPQATNYDPQATISDGSCEYPQTNLTASQIGTLPAELDECSGFVRYGDSFIGINDSGSGPVLTFLDGTNFGLTTEVELSGAVNVDWEELAIDDSFLYVGDFGNNLGSRMDLKIYKVPLADIQTDPQVESVISFSYEDQTDFQPVIFNTPFDCEAFVVKGDSIHLFTKDWGDNFTRHYWIPNAAGDHEAQFIDSFFVNALITGASLVADSMLLLTGYGSESLCWLFKDYAGADFLSGNKRRINLGDLGQNESVTWVGEGNAIITNEGSLGSGLVHQFNFLDLITSSHDLINPLDISIFPSPFSEYLQINLPTDLKGEISLYDTRGHLQLRKNFNQDINLKTDFLPTGFYFLHIKSDGSNLTFPIIKAGLKK